MTLPTWDHETILAQFRHWLQRTADEAASQACFAEPAPPAVGAESASLSALLSGAPEIGLRQVIDAFTALRHEVKLQTRSARGADEQVQSTLRGLEQAIGQFESVPAKEQEAAQRAALPLVQALVGLDEALWRGAQAFAAAGERLAAAQARCQGSPDEDEDRLFADEYLAHDPDDTGDASADPQRSSGAAARLREAVQREYLAQSWWRRWLTRSWHARLLARIDDEAADHELADDAAVETPDDETDGDDAETVESLGSAWSAASELARLREGFELIVQRSRRTLREHGIDRIAALGQIVDPSLMSVVELVDDPRAEPETVVEEIRPGYLWRGQVVRYAEVRVASPARRDERAKVLAFAHGDAADNLLEDEDLRTDDPVENDPVENSLDENDPNGNHPQRGHERVSHEPLNDHAPRCGLNHPLSSYPVFQTSADERTLYGADTGD